MSRVGLNSLGLVLDIVGAMMLWYFAVEISYADKGEFLKGHARLRAMDPTPHQVRAYRRNVLLSRVGIILLVLGFLLQLTSNYAS